MESDGFLNSIKRFFSSLGAVVTAVVIIAALIITVVVVRQHSSPGCELTAIKPTFDAKQLQNIPSSDFKALARFAGYLEYTLEEESGAVFMPLAVESVSKSGNLDEGLQFLIATNCSKITFIMRRDQDPKIYSAEEVRVDLNLASGGYQRCYINNFNYKIDIDKHFACSDDLKFACRVSPNKITEDNKKIATLNLNVLEFEFNGDPESTKKKKFSTAATRC